MRIGKRHLKKIRNMIFVTIGVGFVVGLFAIVVSALAV